MKKLLPFLLFFLLILSCEKSEPLFCYECSTYSNNELLFTTSGCGMDDEHLHTLQVGMETEAWMILGMDARVECKRK
jgi:hypothetical protein